MGGKGQVELEQMSASRYQISLEGCIPSADGWCEEQRDCAQGRYSKHKGGTSAKYYADSPDFECSQMKWSQSWGEAGMRSQGKSW